MIRGWLWTAGWCAVIAAATATRAAAADGPKALGPPAAVRDADATAAWIDQQFAADWEANHVRPAAAADDAEFLRRVYLDLAGRIPTVAETRAFLDDKRPDKRRRLVEQTAGRPALRRALHQCLAGAAAARGRQQLPGPLPDAWLRGVAARTAGEERRLRPDGPRTADGPGRAGRRPRLRPSAAATPTPARLLSRQGVQAGEPGGRHGPRLSRRQRRVRPVPQPPVRRLEARAVLGLRRLLRRHPAAAAEAISSCPAARTASKHELTIPGTEQGRPGRLPRRHASRTGSATAGNRATLADWMTAPDNPYFARAAVNRIWAYFFGTGLVEPVDEMVGGQSTASHPELLDELARQFAAHQFDLKFLIRAITATRGLPAQQRPQRTRARTIRRLFARMPLRGLTAEQLFDSVAEATGYRDAGRRNEPTHGLLGGNRSARAEFLTKFATDRAADRSADLDPAGAVADERQGDRRRHRAWNAARRWPPSLDAPFLDTTERIETLYLATLSRKPTPRNWPAWSSSSTAAASRRREAGDARRTDAYNRPWPTCSGRCSTAPNSVLNH